MIKLFTLLIFFFLACNTEKQTQFAEIINLREDKFNNISIDFTEKGKLKLVITGKELLRKKTEHTEEPIAEFSGGFHANFYDSLGNIETTIKALFCRINEKTRFMYMKGNVYIETIKGDVIKSNDLTWDNTTEKFYTADSIDIKRPNEHIKGIGFEGNSDLSIYKIFKSTGKTKNKTITLYNSKYN